VEIPVNITRPTLKQIESEWAVGLNKLPRFLAASRSLVRDDAVQVFIKVINLSDDKFTVRRDSFVGTAEPVQIAREINSAGGRGTRDIVTPVYNDGASTANVD